MEPDFVIGLKLPEFLALAVQGGDGTFVASVADQGVVASGDHLGEEVLISAGHKPVPDHASGSEVTGLGQPGLALSAMRQRERANAPQHHTQRPRPPPRLAASTRREGLRRPGVGRRAGAEPSR